MWEPIGKVTVDFELMIKDTDWVNFAGGTNWHGRQARKDHELEGTTVGNEADKIINLISDGSWHYVLNRTLNYNITKPHKDWGYEVPWDRYTWNLKDKVIEESSRQDKLELAKKWRRFWIPMRDREFGQFFESAHGILSDWKAGDIFNLPANEYHAGATVGFDDRYTMLVEGFKDSLNEDFQNLV